MNTTPPPDDALGALCARWRSRTLAAGWRMPEDWSAPAAVRLAEAVLRGLEAEAPAAALGAARARAGVGVTEGLRDLGVLFETCSEVLPVAVTLAFAAGWETADVGPPARAASSGMSGLPGHDEFLARAEDTLAGVHGARGGGSPVLVIIDGRTAPDLQDDVLGRLARWERDVLLGEAVRAAFDADCPVGYDDGLAVVLGWSQPAERTASSVARVRALLTGASRHGSSLLRSPVRITVRPLPEDPGALRRLVTADEAA
ncbi:hypothetical protein [Myceligenerans pegani]|uniref:GGDEF domain-containing protein n=1 Tax=Myceligenerans pegani TaxID=2776917 RepID=A0ABR9N187_9MICO|nr:hypothetical protein [Myceligenerans sp. TRM 65318]MBE1877422.1 hypothetical protein [Myceligenerans sp. TRM 65318]MBE3019693.1 hypothetical protein [Myceligenerans sp. TRM 65318]